jgi:cytochrome c556
MSAVPFNNRMKSSEGGNEMELRRVRTRVILGSLVVLAVVGCATGQTTTMTGSGDPVADRQRLMKNNGANWAEIQAKVKAGNAEAVAVNAEALSLHAQRIPGLFPEGSLTDKSKAKPDIWQKWPEFQAAAKNLENRAGTLRDQAVAKDAAAVTATVATFGRDACGTCHTPFRVPPPQQQPAAPRS